MSTPAAVDTVTLAAAFEAAQYITEWTDSRYGYRYRWTPGPDLWGPRHTDHGVTDAGKHRGDQVSTEVTHDASGIISPDEMTVEEQAADGMDYWLGEAERPLELARRCANAVAHAQNADGSGRRAFFWAELAVEAISALREEISPDEVDDIVGGVERHCAVAWTEYVGSDDDGR